MPDVVSRRTAGLLRPLARDDCPDGSEKADIVERLVEMRLAKPAVSVRR
jgi:hypothetical protein